MKKTKIGIYAGSFNPYHVGHHDILNQTMALFDMVFLAVGNNSDKVGIAREKVPSVTQHTIFYNGLLTDMLKKTTKEWDVDVTLIRGIRNGTDLATEQNQIAYMKGMYPQLKVVYFVCGKEYEHISSSSLRSLRKFSEEEYQKYIVK